MHDENPDNGPWANHDIRDDAEDEPEQAEGKREAAGGRAIEGPVTLRFEIRGAGTLVAVPLVDQLVIGRQDPGTGFTPDLDLTPYGGYQMGISRRHAVIRVRENQLQFTDLGSRNGTYINGNKLPPQRTATLHHGDEIRVGKILLNIYVED
jgi:pSer/pThr/pTyr-binding forkhead associated (FHA) protein